MKKNIYIQPSIEVTAQLYTTSLCKVSGGANNDPLQGGGGIGGD